MTRAKIILLTAVLLTASINLFSQTAEEWKKLGNVELDSANYEKAIEYYRKAIEVDSNYFDAYHNLGLSFDNLNEFDTAIEYYKKAISINDTVSDTYFTLGIVYAKQSNYDAAIEIAKKGVNLNPNYSRGYYALGIIYQEKGNWIYANLYLKKAAQLGDTLVQQYLIDNEMSWEDNFEKPDYEQIKANIENKESNFYYSKLWNRFQQGDSTMTLEEKRHLYYGYVFHKDYSPYSSTYNSKKANAILNKKNPTRKEWETLVSIYDHSLSKEPFNCKHLYYQHIAYNALNKSVEADKNAKKIHSILGALYSTGDGLLKECAMHVIAVYSEYDCLFFNDLSMYSQAFMNGGYDVLYLNPNEDGLEELWFDITQPFNYLRKSSK